MTSLRAVLRDAGRLDGRALHDAAGSVALADLAGGTALDVPAGELAGHAVAIVTDSQMAAALALVALDGVAARLVLCPPDLPPDHLAAVIAAAGVDTIVSDRPGADFGGFGARVVRCALPIRPLRDAPPAMRPTEWVLLTSGTTGVPKLVVHSLAGLTGAIASGPSRDDATVWGTFYDIRRYGGLQIFLRALHGRGSLVLSQAGEPVGDHLRRLAAAGVSHLTGTPSHWRRALMSPAAAAISPRYVRLSGEIADQAVLDSLRSTYPDAALGHAYASTEAGVGFEVTDGREGFPAALLEASDRPVQMKVVDGTLRVRSPRAASGYLGAGPRLTDDDGFVDTGDMVERRGDRYHFVGRVGGIINVGGLKVNPEEVERAINAHRRVRMSLVKARRSPILGAVVVAEVVLADGAGEAEAAVKSEIMAMCRAALPQHKVPAAIRFVPTLEVTAGGKLARHNA
jgi:acyl-coenzyme A synthetase/AMP-(fatty) acid ligase